MQGDEWLAGLDTDRESQEEESEEEDYSRPYGQSDKVLSMTATEHVFVVMAKYCVQCIHVCLYTILPSPSLAS